jgi:hypothetical protein
LPRQRRRRARPPRAAAAALSVPQEALRGHTTCRALPYPSPDRGLMNNVIYIVGLIVIVIAILSFFGLR